MYQKLQSNLLYTCNRRQVTLKGMPCLQSHLAAEAGAVHFQAMATDIDRLNVAGPTSPALSASVNYSSVHTINDMSMCSSPASMQEGSCHSTPTSKRQRLTPLEVPEFTTSDFHSAQHHRLADSGHPDSDQHLESTPNTQRHRDAQNKPPVSPSDPCYGMDLRKAALLRSLMLATDGPSAGDQGQSHGKGKSKNSKRVPRVMAVQSADSASMDLDSRSDRSSVSPDTAASKILLTQKAQTTHNAM